MKENDKHDDKNENSHKIKKLLKMNSSFEFVCPKCDSSTGVGGKFPRPAGEENVWMTCDSCDYEDYSSQFKIQEYKD